MTLRFPVAVGVLCLILSGGLLAESPATSAPPGQLSSPSATNAQPETAALPQAATKSAPGAQDPNGANGVNLNGQGVSKSPGTPSKKNKKATAASKASANVASASAAPAPAANTPPPAPAKPMTVLDSFLQDLDTTLKFSPAEKKEIDGYFEQDAMQMQKILNDDSTSPLAQDDQVSDLRARRNDKVDALLSDSDRQQKFYVVEADYRVALVEAAAAGTLCPAQVTAPPAAATTAPASVQPTATPGHPDE